MEDLSLKDAQKVILSFNGLYEEEKDQALLALSRGGDKQELLKLARELDSSRRSLNTLAKRALDPWEALKALEGEIVAAQRAGQQTTQVFINECFAWKQDRVPQRTEGPVGYIDQYEELQRTERGAY